MMRFGLSESFVLAWSYAKTSLLSMMCDRAMFIADFFLATTIPYVIQFFIWTYVYDYREAQEIEGFGKVQLLLYFAYALALGRFNNGYDIAGQLSDDIQVGRLDVFLSKPLAFPLQRFFGFVGESIVYLIPMIFIAYVHYIFSGGGDDFRLGYWPAILMVLLLSQILCFIMALLFGMMAFWVVKEDLLLASMVALSALLGGALLPAEFWPEELRGLMLYNPYRYLIGVPAELMVRPSISLLTHAFGGLLIWGGGLGLLAVIVWKRGMRRYVGAGG